MAEVVSYQSHSDNHAFVAPAPPRRCSISATIRGGGSFAEVSSAAAAAAAASTDDDSSVFASPRLALPRGSVVAVSSFLEDISSGTGLFAGSPLLAQVPAGALRGDAPMPSRMLSRRDSWAMLAQRRRSSTNSATTATPRLSMPDIDESVMGMDLTANFPDVFMSQLGVQSDRRPSITGDGTLSAAMRGRRNSSWSEFVMGPWLADVGGIVEEAEEEGTPLRRPAVSAPPVCPDPNEHRGLSPGEGSLASTTSYTESLASTQSYTSNCSSSDGTESIDSCTADRLGADFASILNFGMGSDEDAAEWASWGTAAAAMAAAAGAAPAIVSLISAESDAMDTTDGAFSERRRRHSSRQPVPSLKVKLAVASRNDSPPPRPPSRTLSKRSRALTSKKTTKKSATVHEATPKSPGRRRQRHQCPHCDKLLDTKYKLERHVRTHTGEKPFKCEVCTARFNQKSSLKTHSTIHARAVLRDPSTTKATIESYTVNGHNFEALGIPYASFVYDAIQKQRLQ